MYKLIATLLFSMVALIAVAQQDNAWLKTLKSHSVHYSVGKGTFSNAPEGFALYFSDAGNIRVPYIVYVPKGYDPAKPTKLVVFLHGAVLAQDSFQHTNPSIADEPIFSVADMYNTIVLFPFARNDFKWTGAEPLPYENVVRQIKETEKRYNIDLNRVYIGGISMGGIATFWYVNHHPDLFAGFYTFSAIPRQAEGSVKFKNLTKDKPMYSIHAKDDPGFTYTDILRIYEDHKNEAPGWDFTAVETGGHRFIYNSNGKEIVQSLIGKLLAH